ncbi:uncharacterized protein LOC126978374 [Leptidea sinapis]|uniref:uncharacterized protein LOC126978374 n=1 Tax=Leptidea sinapis TaxID=189913 RepID=UPI00212A0368|nr:uncharacterized protein LOC126978374 [Leptidea sinapis]
MKSGIILLILQFCIYVQFATSEEPSTKDLADYENVERKHHKKKKHQNNPCNGVGRLFGPHEYSNTYISAPTNNYFFGCGGFPAPYPVNQNNGHGGHGHGGHGHGGHGHGGHGHGGHGHGGYGHGQGGNANFGSFNGYQPHLYNQGYQTLGNPLQNILSSATTGFGNTVANYFTRPRKTYRKINRLINNLF